MFSIPSGGFGNGFSGYLAKRMGLPIQYFIPAVNENDTLHRFFTQGSLLRRADRLSFRAPDANSSSEGELAPANTVIKTISPAMGMMRVLHVASFQL